MGYSKVGGEHSPAVGWTKLALPAGPGDAFAQEGYKNLGTYHRCYLKPRLKEMNHRLLAGAHVRIKKCWETAEM